MFLAIDLISYFIVNLDILAFTNKPKRIVAQIKELCSILSGLVIASDYKRGQELFATRDFEKNEGFFQAIFELGRRHKVRLNTSLKPHSLG